MINGNTFDGGGVTNGERSAAIAMLLTGGGAQARVRNNILFGGRSMDRFGVYERNNGTAIGIISALDHNAFGNIDTAYRNHDAMGEELFTSVAVMEQTLAMSDNIDGACTVDENYRLSVGALCVDAGTTTEAPASDIDGEPRPMRTAIDIGADEVP